VNFEISISASKLLSQAGYGIVRLGGCVGFDFGKSVIAM
jgi:hypothetical protein